LLSRSARGSNPNPGPGGGERRQSLITTILVLLLGGLFAVTTLRNGWIDKDAYITFRTIDNLAHGFGPDFNIDERVQAYTHPLWMLTMAGAYLVTREFTLTAILARPGLSWYLPSWCRCCPASPHPR
jgi:hypothetical protein